MLLEPIVGAAAWTGADLAHRTDWIHHLTPAEVADVDRVVAALGARGTPREHLTPADVTFDALAPAIAAWRETLARGRGFVLVRGLPVERMTADEAVAAYWALGLHLGTPVPQNFQGELLTDIRDTGADPNDPSTRLYKTRAEQDFHTDGADIIGLLCLRTSKRGGESRIVSSVSVVNELLRRRPEPRPRSSSATSPGTTSSRDARTRSTSPVRSARDRGGGLNTFFIPWYIRRAQELPDVPRMTADQTAALEMLESIANDPALYLDMEFRPGDIQLAQELGHPPQADGVRGLGRAGSKAPPAAPVARRAGLRRRRRADPPRHRADLTACDGRFAPTPSTPATVGCGPCGAAFHAA